MPMLSPLVWILHGPPSAIRLEDPYEAARIVYEEGDTVCLPTYEAGRRTIVLLGAEPAWADYLVSMARRQPQWQLSYDSNRDRHFAPAATVWQG